MLARLKAEFSRYFLMNRSAPRSNIGGMSMFSMLGRSSGHNRDEVSEILQDRLYLTNLPRTTPFSEDKEIPDISDAALVVSCVDIAELAASPLLLEPNAKQIKYHVLAMEDCSAEVDSPKHIFDTLQLMSQFAENNKHILVHCFSGVGRSAMITALHIAHRYLLDDKTVKALIDSKKSSNPLNPADEDFVERLYKSAANCVLSKRSCCQFDSTKNNIAISILSALHKKIQLHHPIITHEENYQFLADFVQSTEYKKLQHYFYHSGRRETSYSHKFNSSSRAESRYSVNPQDILKEFFELFLSNDNTWYQQLVNAVRNESSGNSRLYQYCNGSDASAKERRDLLNGMLEIITLLAFKYPNALHSQQALTALEHEATLAAQTLR